MQAAGNGLVVAAKVLALVAALQVLRRERLKADEDAAQPRSPPHARSGRRARWNPPSRRPETAAPCPSCHQTALRKTPVAEQMIVEKIEMASRQPVDLRQRIVHPLCVESLPTLKERILVTEVAMLRASARHHDGIRHQIIVAPDEIAAHRRKTLQRAPPRGGVNAPRAPRAKVL
jgi:hypothetical protein